MYDVLEIVSVIIIIIFIGNCSISLSPALWLGKSSIVSFRRRKQHMWMAAAKYLSKNESRVRQQVKTINGEECNVWCWVDVSIVPLFISM